ncbi:MAG: hypothetical protein RLZZ26_51 [Candidatus Parcubacteria bacterium]
MELILLPRLRRGTANYREAVALARALVRERLQHFNQVYGYQIGKVAIRKQRTRWGSCSKQGNLNFNYRIIHLPESERDYVIAHELCHIGEFNHSKAFWDLLARAIPDWKARRAALRRYRF